MFVDTAPLDRTGESMTTLVHRIGLHDRQKLARRGEPIILGLPLPRGACAGDPSDLLRLVDAAGRRIALQTTALDRWSDGSIRWVLLDFQADTSSGAPTAFALHVGTAPLTFPSRRVTIVKTHEGIDIDTGAATFSVCRAGRFPFTEVRIDGRPALEVNGTALQLKTVDGRIHDVWVTALAVEDAGPLRATIRYEGALGVADGEPLLQVTVRLQFFAGLSTIRADITATNPRRAKHPGGFWELGDAGSVHFRDLSLRLAIGGDGPLRIRCSPETGAPFETVEGPLQLYQNSSGGENWRSSNHLNQHLEIPLRFRGYEFVTATGTTRGLRATPIVSATRRGASLAVAMPQFWENFPKAVEVRDHSIVLRLFPRQHADTFEMQGGEQKTHTCFICFGDDSVTDVPLAWTRDRLFAQASPSSYCATQAVPNLTAAATDPHDEYLQLVNAAIEGEDTFDRKRERVDEYGWRHFGDLHADHETAFEIGAGPVRMSHYNNQYDAAAGLAYQFLRSGDRRWWDELSNLAAHVVDVDIYHTDRDKAAYNGGLFWHTAHYVDAAKATHRSYPRAKGVGGGGPSCEHNYSTGLMLHYFLTGSRTSREAVIALAQWVIAMDDGRRSVLRWVTSRPTGLASATASYSFHGPGRGAGNSINVLLDAYRLSRDGRFLAKADELIRRCVHPADDIPSLDLLDAERRWSYTVFLQALGKYLDEKAERGDLNEMYTYARESLLAYARWMADHERPYLKKPERLEYPTETWAAQDMRKSEVFKYAARHAPNADRQRFLERADFFFHSSTNTLLTMRTRTFTRPIVLLLSNGFMHAYFARHLDSPAPAPTCPHGLAPKPAFVPQKVRAKRVLAALALALLGATGAFMAAWLEGRA